jgi:hypothetical protein
MVHQQPRRPLADGSAKRPERTRRFFSFLLAEFLQLDTALSTLSFTLHPQGLQLEAKLLVSAALFRARPKDERRLSTSSLLRFFLFSSSLLFRNPHAEPFVVHSACFWSTLVSCAFPSPPGTPITCLSFPPHLHPAFPLIDRQRRYVVYP